MAESEPVIIPMLEQYTEDTSVLAQYLLEEIYQDYHAKRLVFMAAPERRLVPTMRWRKAMLTRANNIFDALPGLQREKIIFLAILSVSAAFMEAIIYSTDNLWVLMVEHLTASKSSIEFFARSRGLPWLRAVRELIPRFRRRDPEVLMSAFSDHTLEIYSPPNFISDEDLHRNLNNHGPNTFYLSMTGAIIPIEAPSFNGAQPLGLQVIDIEECIYDHTLFSRYSRTPDWPWQTWPRHPQVCAAPDIDDETHDQPRCGRCGRDFSTEEEWHNADAGCQCHDLFECRDILIQIVEYPPFPDQPDVVNRGVRALQTFGVQTILGEYTGFLVPNTTHDPESEFCDNVYLFALSGHRRTLASITSRLYGNWTRFINHTDDEDKQNVKFVHTLIMNRVRVLVKTTKEITVGEEILGHYGDGYFTSRQLRRK
ncbi:hypothetical protein V493_06210 [Pseudogymnoascus sp. VKM F-4281 (FW-2241)]|nr:hypothetical protein V493_06210 [Pseudogymnoascus sp. VKM F-4281 (FW-2241)]